MGCGADSLGGEAVTLFWLSFCDADRPAGTQFLGACLVEAEADLLAVARAHDLGINPGGEVLMVECPSENEARFPPPITDQTREQLAEESREWVGEVARKVVAVQLGQASAACPHPARKGRHEWYGANLHTDNPDWVCRACGATAVGPLAIDAALAGKSG